ncbi:G-type lectin S-receptor-like serine/threonine-protein kinase LECRK1 [Abrus precatorius]|uniref:Receptor-like serine/threonine-protein kinase n=1 Tax=Abrus precatorius TaxID=3816 RepID=A0A8B8MJ80_ABRPR|nr:G-type lectin S-receptor-like serine/threonine-protein kinase LECRK1 [Abrus precatorius]
MDTIVTTIILLMLMFASTRAQTQPPKQHIALGTTLFPNSTHSSFWPSPLGQFAFGFYPEAQGTGFVVAIWLVSGKSKTVVWTANRNDPAVTSNAKLQLTMDGKLVLKYEQGQAKVIAVNTNNAKASFACMLDSGNFVLYDKNSSIIWQTFDFPTDTLLGGQSLFGESQLVSSSSEMKPSSGRFRLKIHDGALGLYPVNTSDLQWDAYWTSTSTSTPSSSSKIYLYLNQTGQLELKNVSDFTVEWLLSHSSLYGNEEQIIYRATLDPDGIFRLYVHFNNGTVQEVERWPGDEKACGVKGFCGFNSYCTVDDEHPVCNCLDGFEFIDPNERTLGCKSTFEREECRWEKDGAAATLYNMTLMKNLVGEDRVYFMAKMSQEDDCTSACLFDCNCWASLYDSQARNCKKLWVPLRYVRRKQSSDPETSLFLKVGLGNKKLSGYPGPEQPPQPLITTTSNKATVQIIVITSVFALLLCLSIAISSHYMYKIRVLRYKRLVETGNLGLNEEVTLRRFSYSELKKATNHFKQGLGKGSFGAVYKGALSKGKRSIAVKRLEKLVEEGEREFQAEMRVIGKTHHRNLVRLLGFCAEGSKRLLVYEYMTNGSLEKLIFGATRRLDWDERVRIAVDVARGILYLHEECEAPIIHCDIKPQNILMDELWTAKISDFGLAKLLMPDQTRTFTGVRGTRGYVAPEWHKNTPISVKADIYSYGIELLEILCCRRNIEVTVSEPEEVLLSGWAYKCFVARQLNKLVPWEAVDKNVFENMVKVALWCIQDEPFLRPSMKSVVLMLEGITDVAIPPCPDSNSV